MPGEKKSSTLPFLKVYFETLDEFVEAYSQHISKGGMFIKTPVQLKGGQKIKVELKLKNNQSLIRGIAEVIWEKVEGGKTTGVGIKFIQLTPESLKFLEQIQKKLKEKEEEILSAEEVLEEPEEIIEEPEVVEEKVREVLKEPSLPESQVVEPEDVSKESGLKKDASGEEIAEPQEEFLAPPEEVIEKVPGGSESKTPSKKDVEKVVTDVVEPTTKIEISSGKMLKNIIVVVVILAVAGVAGYFVFLSPQKSEKVEIAAKGKVISGGGKKIPGGVLPEEVITGNETAHTVTSTSPSTPSRGISERGEKEAAVTKARHSPLPPVTSGRLAKKIIDIKVLSDRSEIILDGSITRRKIRTVALNRDRKNYPRIVVRIRIPQKKLSKWVVHGKGRLRRIRLGLHPPEVWLVYDFNTGRRPPHYRVKVVENKILLYWR